MTIKRVVVSYKCLPTRSPLLLIAVLYLLLDRYGNCPDWAWGVFWTLAVILYAGFWVVRWTEEEEPVQGFGEKSTRTRAF